MSNTELTMKFKLVRSPPKQIDTNFGCVAPSFQLISIASLLNLSSCDRNIWKVNISDVYESETSVPFVSTLRGGVRSGDNFKFFCLSK